MGRFPPIHLKVTDYHFFRMPALKISSTDNFARSTQIQYFSIFKDILLLQGIDRGKFLKLFLKRTKKDVTL
jgi:hypothetical protein